MEALEIRPSDADLHHLLGRFKYEVANLSWIEKKVCLILTHQNQFSFHNDNSFQATDFLINFLSQNSKNYIYQRISVTSLNYKNIRLFEKKF